ncbi:hypothetical protein [Tahibacter sp.]|uniref:hypothetical protein n=1 Tax=Tahibacter sp. TaxID=2056211 RepID=UPI0028C3C799|nr:hypothetical protein [Tahibacter sp.]
MRIEHVLAALAFVLVAPPAFSADGDPDISFSGDGKAIFDWPAPGTLQAETRAVATGADGSVTSAGWISYSNVQQYFAATLTRFRSNGELDTAFATQGVARITFNAAPRVRQQLRAVTVLADGKVLGFGSVRTGEGSAPELPVMVRLTSAGLPDPAFGVDGKRVIDTGGWPLAASLEITAGAWQSDGKLVGVGTCRGCGSDPNDLDIVALRVGPDGVLDPAFGSSGWSRIEASALQAASEVAIDDLGRIVIAGVYSSGTPQLLVARLTATGSPDTNFGSDAIVTPACPNAGTTTCSIGALAVGRTAGDFFVRRIFIASNRSGNGGVLGLTDGGTPSPSFGNNGFLDLSLEEGTSITALAVDTQRRLLAVGTIDPDGGSGTDFLAARTNFSGDLDDSFDGNGVARYAFEAGGISFDTPRAIAFSAQRPVLAGTLHNIGAGTYHVGVLRLQEDRLFADDFD